MEEEEVEGKPTNSLNINEQAHKMKNEEDPNVQDVVVKKRTNEVELLDSSLMKSEPRKLQTVQRLVVTMEEKEIEGKPTNSANKNDQAQKNQTDVGPNVRDVVVKKRKNEVELLDSLLIKSEPRKRHAVQRLVATQAPVRIQKKTLDSHLKEDKIELAQDIACSICNLKFESVRALKLHQHIHTKATQFTCALCSRTFNSNLDLIKHKIVHKDEGRTFLCMKCKSAYTDHLEFLKHQAEHRSIKQCHFCMECGKEFDNKRLYIKHIAIHHDIVVKCDICEADIRQNNMKIHLKLKHTDKSKVKCVECDKMYTPSHMVYHMYYHTGVRPFQCLYCGKGFRYRHQRELHARVHTDERPYQCDLCPYKGRKPTDIQLHRRSHTTVSNIECKICGKKYRQQKFLNDHMDIHNNTQKYVCTICGLKVHTSTNLKSHFERVHMIGYKYECVVCNTSFKTRSDLTKHTNRSMKHKNNLYGYEKKLREKAEQKQQAQSICQTN